MKKVAFINLLLALVLALSLFSVGFAEQSEIPADLEHLDITLALYEFTTFDDPLGKAIEEKFNVSITPLLLDGDINAKLRLWGASDELPDIWASGTVGDGSRLWDFIDQGLIRTIPEDILAKYSYTASKVANNQINKLIKELTGEIYTIPRPESFMQPWITAVQYLAVRNDWMQNLGIEKYPENMDELYELLRAFTLDDPDGNGKDDTYGMTGNYSFLYAAFGAFPNFWIDMDDGIIPGYLEEETMVDALKWLRKVYSEGILDPELVTDDAKFAQGNFGAYLRNMDDYWFNRSIIETFGGANPDLGDPTEVIGLIGPFSKDANSPKYSTPQVDGISGNEYNAKMTDEMLERLLMMDNWLLHGEGNDLRYWGLRDIDFTIDDDGNYMKLNDDILRVKYPAIFIQNWPSWDLDYNALPVNEGGSPYISAEVKAITKAIRDAYDEGFDPANTKVNISATWTWVDAKADYTYNYGAMLTEIITGSDDVEAMYAQLVADAYDYGIQDVIDQVNELLAE